MILNDRLEKPYEKYTIRSQIWLQCDYCGKTFQRIKKTRERLNVIVLKDGCGAKACIAAKKEEAYLIKYGVKNVFQADSFKQKLKESNLSKHGTEQYLSSVEFKVKRQKALITKLGVDSPLRNQEVKEKQQKTCTALYGVANYAQHVNFATQRAASNLVKYGHEHVMQVQEFAAKRDETCLERYGVPNPLCLQQNQRYGKTQKLIQEWCNSMGLSFAPDYSKLLTQEIDMYDDNLHIGIEYCGLFWHSELSPHPRPDDYHYKKYAKCLSLGIRLITIFEDEWKNKQEQCKGFLQTVMGKNETRIYACDCEIVECDRQEFNIFCNQYHIQGGNNLGTVVYVLKNNNEIVAGMSLERHHRGAPILILDRLFFKHGMQIVDGASKLFNRCVKWAKDNQYNTIVSWSDNRWSQGDIYKKLGFTMEKEMPPDYSYVDPKKPYKRLSRQSQKKWALEKGLAKIWDCGKKKWTFST